MDNFRELGITPPILRAIKEQNFETPSEIQAKAIPLVLAGKDVIGGSATGSGKTLAFGSVIIQSCEKGKGIQALILTPTRELAEQVSKALKKFSKYKPLGITAIYGGVSINPQFENLKIADVVVGTPGRILDHIGRNSIDLSRVKILVLDEADRMLDMGFIDDVQKIIRKCPKQRQTMLFSATISRDIQHLSKNYMHNPVSISSEAYVDPKKLTQVYYDIQDNLKFSLLVHLLKHDKSSGLVMVFCNTQRSTDFVARNLKSQDINAVAIHGGFSQAKRTHTMERFHSQNVKVLVCTDVAARGLDIKGVSHVYNFDIPKESKAYIHRIGRTARAGKMGKAINLLASRDHDNFTRVLRDNDVKIVREKTPNIERVQIKSRMSDRSYGRGGPRRGMSRGGGPRDRGPRRDGQRHGGPRSGGPSHRGPRRDGQRHGGQRRSNRGRSERQRTHV
jgi:ATP-dependent RNA helicase DeaD